MASTSAFAATPRVSIGVISAANTNRDGSGTLVDIFTAGASGSRIERLKAKATAAVTAGMIRLYLYDGTVNRLIDEIQVSAVTPSATVPTFEGTIDYSLPSNLLVLPAGYKLRAAPHNAESFVVTAIGGDF